MRAPNDNGRWIFPALVLLVIYLWLWLVASTRAADGGFGPMLRQDFAAAQHYWGGPSPLCSTVERRVIALPLGEGGEATEPYPGYYGPCHLYVAQSMIYEPRVVCTIIIHEDGHLHGLGHSPDPTSVMYPKLTTENIPGICYRLYPKGNAS